MLSYLLPAFILLAALGNHISITPPRPPANDGERKSSDYPSLLHLNTSLYKYLCWFHAVIEVTLVAVPPVANYIPGLQGSPRAISFPPLRVFGGILMISGSTLRWLCFRELGKYFTFQVAILKDHKLITTGPYSFIRHPAYTAASLLYIGSFLWHATPGSWMMESTLLETKLSIPVFVNALIMYWWVVTMVTTRPPKEDELLKKEFGRIWEEWAEAVPCRLIPGIY